MIVLGIEGTAHTVGVGVVDHGDPTGPPRILADLKHMWRPEVGGIHPREAANHHAERVGPMIRDALAVAGLRGSDVDLVGFSRGPGLGPCLRTVATAARAFALAADRPVIGVNHCVAHLEIGRAMTGMDDPILLYASGGNTQVIAYTEGRYRVLGETLDVGVGNMLDKFARELGQPFPGGPHIETLAKGSTGDLADLPYSIRGMDVAFSGVLTAALALHAKGVPKADLAHAMQETVFAMLTEVTERALAHVEKDEVVLGGGVACNERLRDMVATMATDRGAKAAWPSKALCVDNGVMIAHTGARMHEAGVRHTLEDTVVDQRFRTDDVDVTWRTKPPADVSHERQADARFVHGAEARVEEEPRDDFEAIRKARVPKAYRHEELDRRLRVTRTRMESKLLSEARRVGVRTPVVLDLDDGSTSIVMERLRGTLLKDALRRQENGPALAALGRAVATLHRGGFVHGDLTTSNAIVLPDGTVALIDFGLGGFSEEDEARGVDLHVLMESLEASHADHPAAFEAFLSGYREADAPAGAERALKEIVRRGRYRGT